VRTIRDNGLTIVLALLFLGSLIGHWLVGVRFENAQLLEHGEQPIGAFAYLAEPQFLSTLFENWESEFLQMAAYVILTAILFQRGSAESRDPDQPESHADRAEPSPDSPAATRKGPLVRWLYAHSLGLVLLSLFLITFALHWHFSALAAAEEAALHGGTGEAMMDYLWSEQLWFESFQNWQSEFFSAGALVVLSIWLRQRGSPESKPVDAPHSQTGT
jgi:hypothetical protein